MSARDVRSLAGQDWVRADRPIVSQDFAVFIREDAFDRMVDRGNGELHKEIGGILVGDVLCDESGPYVVVDTTIDALHAEEKGAELTITHATWDHIHAEMDSAHKGKRIVGWYHTHPGFGVFLSDRDQFIHSSFFDLPFQIAFVYDPVSREHGLFHWRNNAPERLDRYWVGEHMHRLDVSHNLQTTPASVVEDNTVTAAPSATNEGGWGPWLLAMIVGFVGFGVGWMFSSPSSVPAGSRTMPATVQPSGTVTAPVVVNAELVRIVRNALDQESIDQAIVAVQKDLASVEQAVQSDEAPALDRAALRNDLKRAKEKLQRFRKQRAVASDLLRSLQSNEQPDYELLRADVNRQRETLAGLLSELARETAELGKKERARRHLLWASQLDPRNHARYENQLKRIDPKASLPALKRPVKRPKRTPLPRRPIPSESRERLLEKTTPRSLESSKPSTGPGS